MTVPYADRQFRHLCTEADLRDSLNDDEFWARVDRNLGPVPDMVDAIDQFDQDQLDGLQRMQAEPCTICGSEGACGYDAEGRALIHAESVGEDSG